MPCWRCICLPSGPGQSSTLGGPSTWMGARSSPHSLPSFPRQTAHNERNMVPLEPASPGWLKTCTYVKSRFKGGHLPLKSQSQKKPFPAGRARMSLLSLMPKKGGLWGTGVPWPWMQKPPGWDLPQTGCFWGTNVTPNLCHVS